MSRLRPVVLRQHLADGPGRAACASHREAHLIAAALNAPLLAAGLGRGRWKRARPVSHLAINAAETDRTLSDEQWVDVVGEYLHRIGLAPRGDEEAVRWVAPAVTYRRRTTDEYDRRLKLVRESNTINARLIRIAPDLAAVPASRLLADLVQRRILVKTSEAQRGPSITYGPGPDFPAAARRRRSPGRPRRAWTPGRPDGRRSRNAVPSPAHPMWR